MRKEGAKAVSPMRSSLTGQSPQPVRGHPACRTPVWCCKRACQGEANSRGRNDQCNFNARALPCGDRLSMMISKGSNPANLRIRRGVDLEATRALGHFAASATIRRISPRCVPKLARHRRTLETEPSAGVREGSTVQRSNSSRCAFFLRPPRASGGRAVQVKMRFGSVDGLGGVGAGTVEEG